MATIPQLPSGRWQAQVRQRNGPPASKSFPNRVDAIKWARICETEGDRGLSLDRNETERTTVAGRIDREREESQSESAVRYRRAIASAS